MSVVAKPMPMLLSASRETSPDLPAPAAAQTLAQRYQDADQHERLCLWLQFREARPALSRLDDAAPAPAPRPGGWLARLLGLPRL